MSNVTYWRPKKTSLMPHLPLAETSFESPSAASETAEQQQESCPTCLPSTAPRMSNVTYWRLKKTMLMPHLPIAGTSFASPFWLVPKQPNSSRNRAQHAFPAQRPECLTSRTDALKKQVLCHTYPLQKAAVRVHRLVPKQPNSSRNRAQHAFPAQRPECLTSRTDALKKQVLCHIYPLQKPALRVHRLVPKQPNSSRNRAQHAFPAQRPECLTSRTDALKKTSLMPHLPLAETSFESPSAGSETAEQQQESCPTCLPSTAPRMSNVTYWRPKKTSLMPHLPLAETSFGSPSAGSETAEQQQESCPTCLPSTAPRMSNVTYWRPKKTRLMPHLPIAGTSFESPSAGSETAEQQQESCPTCLPSTAPRMSNVAYWRPKKRSLMPHLPLAESSFDSPSAGSETAEHQQESCPTCLPSTAPRITYWRPKKTRLMPHLPLAETSFESPSAGSETAEQQQESCPTCLPSAASRMSITLRPDSVKKNKSYATPTPCRNQLWESIGWFRNSRTTAGIVAQHAFPAQRPECLTSRTDALKKQDLCHTYPLQKPALRVHRLVPKRPNSSRNPAQHAFPAQRPECLTLRADAVKKQVLCHTYPLQKPALRVHRLVPKQPNSSRNRAQHAVPAQRPECLTSRTDALKKQVLCHIYPLQKPALRVHRLVPKQPNSSRNRAQHAFPAQRPECLTSRTDALKKQVLCHTYPLQKPALTVHWLVAKRPNGLVDGWLQNGRTAAYWRPKKNTAYATPTYCRNQLWEFIGWLRLANGKKSCRMASASVLSRSIGLGRLLWRAPPMWRRGRRIYSSVDSRCIGIPVRQTLPRKTQGFQLWRGLEDQKQE